MALKALTVPQWGLAMESGTIGAWHVAAGDTVAPGDEIVDIETSKIANAVEATAPATILRIVAEEGAELPVGGLLAVLGEGDEEDAAIDTFIADFEANFDAAEALASAAGPEPVTEEIAGRRLRYLAQGTGADTPLILIHGWGGDLNNWLFNIADLATDRRVIALDLPGHGGSTKAVGDGGLGTLGQAVLDLMDHLEIDRAHLAGHSMGGAVALTLALDHPARVASVATVCGAGYGTTANPDYLHGYLAAKRRKDLKPVAALLFADQSLVTSDMLEDMIRAKRTDGVAEALQTIAEASLLGDKAIDLTGRLDGLTVPALAIVAAQDQVVPPPDTLPAGMTRETLPEVGHMAHMEAAKAVNTALAAHIRAAS